jgi:hypothetical protein
MITSGEIIAERVPSVYIVEVHVIFVSGEFKAVLRWEHSTRADTSREWSSSSSFLANEKVLGQQFSKTQTALRTAVNENTNMI